MHYDIALGHEIAFGMFAFTLLFFVIAAMIVFALAAVVTKQGKRIAALEAAQKGGR